MSKRGCSEITDIAWEMKENRQRRFGDMYREEVIARKSRRNEN